MSLSFKTLAVLALAAVSVVAESHSVQFENRCGDGTPTLMLQDGSVLLINEGQSYGTDGPLIGATAYLPTGNCGAGGEGCTAVKIDLTNPDSNVGISLASPHAFSEPTAFTYSLCGGVGAQCDNPDCADASRGPSDTNGQVPCNEDDASVLITFC